MIVRYESNGSIVMITQNDHAQVSGLFAAHWGNENFQKPRPHESLVRAAMFHDRGWIRYETGPQLDPQTGKTPNYRQVPNDQAQLDAFEWAGDWLSAIDPYAMLGAAREHGLVTSHREHSARRRQGRHDACCQEILRRVQPERSRRLLPRHDKRSRFHGDKSGRGHSPVLGRIPNRKARQPG